MSLFYTFFDILNKKIESLMKKIISSKTIFLSSLVIIILLFYILSYNFFQKNFLNIETVQNQKNINNLIYHLNSQIQALQKTSQALLHSKIDENHTQNLDSMGIDFIIYHSNIALQTQIYYHQNSEFTQLVVNKNSFKEWILQRLEQSNLEPIIYYNNNYFYISTQTLLNDETLVTGKLLDKNNLKLLSTDFEQLTILNTIPKEFDKQFSSKNIPIISVKTILHSKQLVNYIVFKNSNNDSIFALQTLNQRNFVNEGNRTIHIVNIIMATLLAIILYILYKSQIIFRRILQRDKKVLEQKVEKRTKQLEIIIKKVKRSNKKLHTLAYSDHLTKIDNRRSFFLKANEILQKAHKNQQTVCVTMIDIDNFKAINDQYGHDIGDKVLIAFANTIKDCLQKNEVFGRLGGEEFAIITPVCSMENTHQRIETIKDHIENITISIDAQTILKVTASFGISDNTHTYNIDKILQKADELLYSAKNSGKNTIRSRINHQPLTCDL
jgi:diguanylate cyclase (GGDEF)-like protein